MDDDSIEWETPALTVLGNLEALTATGAGVIADGLMGGVSGP